MKLISILFYLLISSQTLCAEENTSDLNYSAFDNYQDILDVHHIQNKLNKFLVRDTEISQYYILNKESFALFDTPNGFSNQPEYLLNLSTAISPIFSPYKKIISSLSQIKHLPLLGKKIAIDPGHFGGKYSKIELRNFEFEPTADIEFRKNVTIREGDITLYTAYILKELLVNAGAEVIMTRTKIGQGAFSKSYEDWLNDGLQEAIEEDGSGKEYWETATPSQVFRTLYNNLDMKERSKIINNFNPDLTVSIHFNKCGPSTEKKLITPIQENFNMVFIPGAFEKNDLKTQDDRYEFLRLLFTNDLEKSAYFAKHLSHQFTKILNVPPIKNKVSPHVIKIDTGVYSRNLAMTRRVHSPIILGEPLCMDNAKEVLQINTKSPTFQNTRLKEVAMTYFNGIIDGLTSN